MNSMKIFSRIKAAVIGAAVSASALATPFVMPQQNVNAAVDINFAKALQYSLYLYDANMCGTQVGKKSLLNWRDDCHTYDSKVSTPYGTMDLSGGFHDAGDHTKFGLPGAYSATVLGWSYYEFKDAFTKTGQADHLKTITDYFCDYYKRCTVMEGSSVKAFCYQVGNGDTDHASWQSPEKDTFDRPAYFATSSNPCTDVVAETAAALAMNYVNFGNKEDLTYAEALYSFAKTNNKSGHSEQSYYTGTTWLDDLALASIILYKATNNSSYKSDCGNWIQQSNYAYTSNHPLCWDNVWPAANSLYANEWDRVASNVDNTKNQTTSEGYSAINDWGSARYNASCQMVGLVYDKNTNSSKYASWAKGQMEYLFGNNKNGQCYMVGYDSTSVKFPHHRAASGYTNFPSENRGKPYANVLVGALVGGPDKSGNYIDDPDKYTYTEVALDYNAGFVGALAGLYLKYGAGQSVASSVPGASGSGSVTDPIVTTTTTQPVVTTTTTTTTASNPAATTSSSTSANTAVTTKVTSSNGNSGGNNVVNVNEKLDYSNDSTKNCTIPLKQLSTSGIEKIIVNLSANGDMGSNISCGGGVTLTGGNWQQLQPSAMNASGSAMKIEFDVKQYSDNLDYDYGEFQFSYWWGNQQTINVDSIECVVSGGTAVITSVANTTAQTTTTTTAVTTTVPVTTQPSTEPLPGDIDLNNLLYGDVNLDNKINSADVTRLSKYLLNNNLYPLGNDDETTKKKATLQADVAYDGNINNADIAKLVNYALGSVIKLGK